MTQRLVGYIRVSTKAGREDDRFLSPELQRADMEPWGQGPPGRDRRPHDVRSRGEPADVKSAVGTPEVARCGGAVDEFAAMAAATCWRATSSSPVSISDARPDDAGSSATTWPRHDSTSSKRTSLPEPPSDPGGSLSSPALRGALPPQRHLPAGVVPGTERQATRHHLLRCQHDRRLDARGDHPGT